ncbi:diphthine--ammonia ligase [archaeon]|jgi:ABC transporter with metal-binding/Fe-S-binding domain ATP-binding protein|nr:diphthine--ammonia ligase [archaeon]MBT4023198.1 diphthine--ammonia ligase [archaeon]MBT4460687.1 diphthine--ammonia ligase [archaeon]MBT4859119.1 diphthine--ammonia ligase [archaeon]MBT5423516.1 diphthine--ammonia ligase [archaeon]
MKLAALFSGGKDSTLAIYKTMLDHEISCLITIRSLNPDSYMFHTPAIDLTKLQAKSVNIPLITVETKGIKEVELNDLKTAIKKAISDYNIEGIITGAVESVYQATRIQKICNELDLWCFNPIWQKDQIELLKELVQNNFKVIFTGIAAYPLDETWLGKEINNEIIEKLIEYQKKYKINPAGEGGETESLVTYAPFFKKKILIKNYEIDYENHAGRMNITEAVLK